MRNLLRTKLYTLINISGLSLGIACCLLLALYVQEEFEYDTHHARLDDLYRINTHFEGVVGFEGLGSVSPPIPMTMAMELPEIEQAARIVPSFSSENLVQYEDKKFYEPNGVIADSTIFDVITFDFIEGHPTKALTDANTVVISESIAHKLFGDESALNKMILITQGADPVNYKITGVFRPKKSFLEINFLTSIMSEGMGEYVRNDPNAANEWAGQNFVGGYIKLSPGASIKSVEKKMNDVLAKYGTEDLKALGMKKTLFLEPLKSIYLKSEVDKSQRITYIYVIVSIAIFILVLACINFMNLSTAKASKRASEIGIRKVMGAFRGSLISQILGEAIIIVVISIAISLALVRAALPLFNELAQKNISLNSGNTLFFAVALIILAVVTGLLAGSYPAFYISSFQPAEVLTGKFKLNNSSGILRQGLVVFQFVVAIVLVCGMLIISKQVNFMKNKDLGFDPSAKILIPLRTTEAKKNYQSLKSSMAQLSSVSAVSATDYPPGSNIFNDMAFYVEGGSMENASLNRINNVDFGYMEMMGIKSIAGRTFTENRESESKGKLILNRASAKKFGIEPDKIVGQKLYFDWQGQNYNFEVIGVMEDYNQTSLREAVVPIMFQIPEDRNRYAYLIASVNSSGFSESIASIENVWKSQINDTPFEFSFLDENIQKQYNEDQRVSRIITYFAAIAMIICCLGLYGLSSYMAERRLKEIGVRRVMGASASQIVGMMSKEFLKLVLIAFVLGAPLAAYVMHKWLQSFQYRIDLDLSLFALAGLSAVTLALLTIIYESLKAANSNPARILRME